MTKTDSSHSHVNGAPGKSTTSVNLPGVDQQLAALNSRLAVLERPVVVPPPPGQVISPFPVVGSAAQLLALMSGGSQDVIEMGSGAAPGSVVRYNWQIGVKDPLILDRSSRPLLIRNAPGVSIVLDGTGLGADGDGFCYLGDWRSTGGSTVTAGIMFDGAFSFENWVLGQHGLYETEWVLDCGFRRGVVGSSVTGDGGRSHCVYLSSDGTHRSARVDVSLWNVATDKSMNGLQVYSAVSGLPAGVTALGWKIKGVHIGLIAVGDVTGLDVEGWIGSGMDYAVDSYNGAGGTLKNNVFTGSANKAVLGALVDAGGNVWGKMPGLVSKLYFHDAPTMQRGILPTLVSSPNVPDQTVAGANAMRSMDGSIGRLAVTIAFNDPATTAPSDIWVRTFCGPSLATQTIAQQAYTFQWGLQQSNIDANLELFGVLYIWRPSNGTVVGQLFFDQNSPAIAANTNQQNGSFTVVSGSTTALNVLAGDYPVFEMWARPSHTIASSYLDTLMFDGTVEGSVSDNAAFVVFTNPLLLMDDGATFQRATMRGFQHPASGLFFPYGKNDWQDQGTPVVVPGYAHSQTVIVG